MELAGTLINTFVVLAVGAVLTYLTRTWRTELKAEVASLRQELKGEVGSLRQELKGDIAQLESRMDAGFNAVRSDLTAVALAVGAKDRGSSGTESA